MVIKRVLIALVLLICGAAGGYLFALTGGVLFLAIALGIGLVIVAISSPLPDRDVATLYAEASERGTPGAGVAKEAFDIARELLESDRTAAVHGSVDYGHKQDLKRELAQFVHHAGAYIDNLDEDPVAPTG